MEIVPTSSVQEFILPLEAAIVFFSSDSNFLHQCLHLVEFSFHFFLPSVEIFSRFIGDFCD